jgi:hypothetical protein
MTASSRGTVRRLAAGTMLVIVAALTLSSLSVSDCCVAAQRRMWGLRHAGYDL